MSIFKKAKRADRKMHLCFDGPPGSGKSFSALRFAFAAKAAGYCSRIGAIDTEAGSLSLYEGECPDGEKWEFESTNLTQFSPTQYVYALREAEKEGIDLLLIDSLTHAWIGEGGTLDQVDKKGGGTAWKDVTPIQRAMTDAIIHSKIHVVVTLRSKMEYVYEPNEKGKIVPRKLGMAPIQKEGMEYEFDLYGSFDKASIYVTKTRCSAMHEARCDRPGPAFWKPFFDWYAGIDNTTPPASPAADGDTSEEFLDLINLIQRASSKAELIAIGGTMKDKTALMSETSKAALRVSFGEKLKAFN